MGNKFNGQYTHNIHFQSLQTPHFTPDLPDAQYMQLCEELY